MAVTEAQVRALELEKVVPKLRKAFEREGKFYAHISPRDIQRVSNRQMRVPLALRPGGSFQYFNPDGGDLGRGGGPSYDRALVSCVFLSEAMEYTKLAQWSTDTSRQAVVQSVRKQSAEALDEMRRQLDAQLQGDGSGTVGTLSAVSTSGGVDTYTLDSDGFGTRKVRFGQTVQLFNAAGTTLRGEGEITQLDVENKTVQVPSIAGAVATDILVVKGISSPTATEGLFGVQYHHSNASTGTWLGFSRSSTPEIRSNRVNAGGAGLSLPLPRLVINKIGNRIGIDNEFMPEAWTHPAQKHAYEQLAQAIIDIHKKPSEESLNLYFSDNMQLAGAPLRCTFNWDPTRIDFVVKELWGRGELLPLGFYKTDGRRIFEIRGASGGVAAAEVFYLVLGTQTFVSNPAGTGYIDNLAVPVGY